MEEFPPSYQSASAALTEYWLIVSQYVPSSDLCSASRVCQSWYAIFAPILWGNPASHWGIENDRVYVALTRFKRTLKWARQEVRGLTHTLRLPPAQAELYDGPHPEWLGDVLEALPNLQSLIVFRLPFFDHQALIALRSRGRSCQSSVDVNSHTYALRLLIAAYCRNMTAPSLEEALTHFPNLAYLDLSGNGSARNHSVLSKLDAMHTLHILRLQNCQLKDSEMEVLGISIGLRVRSLDLRDNYITDVGVRTLLQFCFRARGTRSRATSGVVVQEWGDWPSGVARPDANILDEFRDESLNENFVKRLTSSIVNRLPSQDLRYSGITHLYLAHNYLSVEGVSSLIKSAQLYVLDIGSFDTSKLLSSPRATSSSSPPSSGSYRVSLPGAEKLIHVLGDFGKELTYLRLHHSVVTHPAPLKEENIRRKATELEGNLSGHELDLASTTVELPTDEPAPRYELPGDTMRIVLSPAIGQKPSSGPEENRTVKRGNVFAPEVAAVERDDADAEAATVLTATGPGSLSHAKNSVVSSHWQSNETLDEMDATASGAVANPILADIHKQRQNLDSFLRKASHGLLPNMLPRVRTLVLTGVPCYDTTTISDLLIAFIRACASELEIARLQTRLAFEPLQVPDGSRASSSAHRAHSTFPLQRIILEMGPPGSSSASHEPESPRTPLGPNSSFRTKSSTEDPDSEALWSARENDFSFFDDDEECGLPAKEGVRLPLSAFSEKIVMPAKDDQSEGLSLPTSQPSQNVGAGKDVVQELAKFRKDRKEAYETALKSGQSYVEGYWPGEIKVVRWQAKAKDQADYYGNVYERGIYR